VKKKNIKEYARLVAKYYLIKEVHEELKALLKGFFQVISKNVIQIFDDDELAFLINGSPEIDLEDWKKYTCYKNEF